MTKYTYVAILLAVILSSAGCRAQMFQAYAGTALPREQIAVLELVSFPPGEGIGARKIDGARVDLHSGDSIRLLPGEHSIQFFPDNDRLSGTGDPITRNLSVEAGKTYVARTVIDWQDRKWHVKIDER